MNERHGRSNLKGAFLLLLSLGVWSAADVFAVEADSDQAPVVEEVTGVASEVAEDTNESADDNNRMQMLMASITIFVLAVFIGFEIITKVPPTLHTPLMSGSNAISGITVVGAILVTARESDWQFVAMLAVVFAMVNVVGGFLVTHRMLAMFKPKSKKTQTQE
jgi:NAD(P) transhydrogenase subunit alpha|tara:strand:- start:1397 stop:1885 length:489 start_codon:yes stop_codon:yes gene_type:complete